MSNTVESTQALAVRSLFRGLINQSNPSRPQSSGFVHPFHLQKAFLEEKDKKLAVAAVTSGQKSPWNCVFTSLNNLGSWSGGIIVC